MPAFLSLMRLLTLLTNLFPVWVLLAGVLALIHPPLFTWFSGPLIVWGLAVIMLGMGITLSVDDFRAVARAPRAVAVGFFAQFALMPFMGWSVANALQLPRDFAAGLILVSCCPGGTASNVVAFLAKGNVALSVLMTMCSTFGAVLLTPVLTKWLAGTFVPVDALGLFVSTIKLVLAPLILGILLNRHAPKMVRFVLPVAPLVSVVTIALICASIIGQSARQVMESGGRLIAAVFLLHVGGFALGYLFARLFGYDKIICRTVSIEVGMQNSGLGAVLARQHFSLAASVPCAISSVFHSVIGSLLAAIWRSKP
jgi:BASS family bile acid:Na+ symporter